MLGSRVRSPGGSLKRLSQLQKWSCDFFCAKFPRLLHKLHLSQQLCAVIDVFLHKLMLVVQLCAVLEHFLRKLRLLVQLCAVLEHFLRKHLCFDGIICGFITTFVYFLPTFCAKNDLSSLLFILSWKE